MRLALRSRSALITAGVALLALTTLSSPVSAASGRVLVYDRSRHVQTVTNPPARRCVPVRYARVPRVVNQTNASIELHTTSTCSRSRARVVAPRRGAELRGLRAIRATR